MALTHCTIDGCGKKHLARGWCGMHYMRWREHGDPLYEDGKDRSGGAYHVVHARLREERGPACEQVCIQCGGPAEHWAWQHRGPSRTGRVSGREIEWGTSTEDYEPMCRSCHTVLDAGGSFEVYPCGHPKLRKGQCQECQNRRTREWRVRQRALKAETGS